jgi:cytochrome P450
MMNGGHTNQTTTFAWSLLHAARSPLLSALRERKTSDLLYATFRETGRLYTNLITLRRVIIPQEIMGKHIPAGTFVACSPVVTARDPALFPQPDKFKPERWLTQSEELDDAHIKNVQRTGASVQFGKGQHACVGEKLGKTIVIDILWGAFLGTATEPGFDIEILSGIEEGVGIDNVGIEAAWAEENLGTPFEKGGPVVVRFSKRH